MGPVIRARVPELIAFAAILLGTLLVWPVGDYPVDDDWAYTRSLWTLFAEGRVEILDWNPMTLVVHLAWGWLFSALFGLGFTTAKLSTIALLFVECAAFVAILRRMGAREATAAAAVLALVFGPLHFFQSFLYATDIPTLAWSTLSLLFYLRGLTPGERRSRRHLLLGSLFCALAFGVRQGGILVAVAVFAYLAVFERGRLREPRTWLACFALPAVAVLLFQLWYQLVHGPTAAFDQSLRDILGFLKNLDLRRGVFAVYALLAYTALPLLPLAVALPRTAWQPALGPGTWRRRLAALVALAAVACFAYVSGVLGRSFPYLGNKLTRFGFLSPNEVIVGAREVLWGSAAAWALSAALLAAAVLFATRWIAGPGPDDSDGDAAAKRRVAYRLVAVHLGVLLLYSLLTLGIAFDRHLLVLAPPALLLLAGGLGRGAEPRPLRFALCLLPFAFYSVAGTHDVHSFSRAAFAAGGDLIERGVDASEIEAGYAFDGWHMYERSWAEDAEGPPPRRARRESRAIGDAWYVHRVTPGVRSKYLVSLSREMEPRRWRHAVQRGTRRPHPRLEAYRVIEERSYRSFWPWGHAPLYVMVDRGLESD